MAQPKISKAELIGAIGRCSPVKSGPEESSPKFTKSVAFKLTPESHRALKHAALDRDMLLSQVLEEAVTEWLAKSRKVK